MKVKNYLLSYNLLLSLGWAIYLVAFCANNFTLNSWLLLLLSIVQGAAVLEILHAYLKWVKSPVLLTALQIFSRLFVVLLLHLLVNGDSYWYRVGLIVISFAWSITEIIRYAYYASLLSDKKITALIWARYSFFILLYPIGITGEALVGVARLVATNWNFADIINLFTIGIFASYLYFFPKLFGYLWKQRGLKLSV